MSSLSHAAVAVLGEEIERKTAAAVELAAAVNYVLDRAQRDAALGELLGPLTEAFERLVAAEAAWLGVDLEEHREKRGEDLS